MDWFWHVLWVCAVVIPVTVMWVAVIIELFRRRDINGAMRFAWLLFVLVVPVIGAVIYLAITWWRAGRAQDAAAPARAEPTNRAGQPAAEEVGP